MRSSKRSFAVLAALVAALIGVSSLFNFASTPSLASSHREAPTISEDPTADATDLYAFVSPDAPDTVTLIANYYPGQDPAGGPNFYRFGDDVTYDINVDNNGDAVADITYRFNFSTTVKNPDVPLYNVGPIESLDSENWNVVQRYTITKITADGEGQLAFEGIVPPVNIGPTSTPNYADLANAAIGTVDGMKVFTGQRDDPFWVDLGAVFDLVTIRTLPGDVGGGLDDLQGLNVLSIALQVPITDLTATGEAPTGADDTNAIIGVWTTASRFATTVINDDGTREGSGELVQVSRLGMPLVNEVVIPIGSKDFFNASQPKDDAQFADAVLHPVLPGVLAALYGIPVPPADADRTDIATVFLTGIPGLNQPENVQASEMLRLNMAIPPADSPNPYGVVAGDTAGFPNGRRLGDEVVDIELRAVAGILFCTFAPDQCPDGDIYNVAPNNQLGGGVHGNDVSFLDEFPYLALPHQGFEHRHHSKSTPARKDRIAEKSGEAEQSPEAESGVTVTLDELNDSGVSGTATLTAVGDNQTKVSIDVTGATGDHPAHIHTGTCDDLNPNPLFPLENVDANGKSETTVDVSLKELTGGGFAINLHKSQQEIGVYTACGNIGG